MPKVIVIGGGVGGLSAAHELARRDGFEVVVYEQRAVAGGKARSMDAIAGTGGRRALPGEHGFRFFPGFYRHLPDTMTRIPYARQPHGVFDNLVASTQIQVAREGRRSELVTPAHFPDSPADWQAILRFALAVATQVGIKPVEQVEFIGVLNALLSACEERRFGQYEQLSWWEFCRAKGKSPAYKKFLADGLTRSLVAARAKEMSARTGGAILLQLLADLATPGRHADRVLNGPTSDVWIDAWVTELRALGVELRFAHRVETIDSVGPSVTSISGHVLGAAGRPGAAFADHADYYVCAVPVEVLREQIAIDALKRRCTALAGLDALQVRWMNGIMFYLRRDVPLVHGHSIYIDSPWALTSISQRQFWTHFNPHDMGDGSVGGILSVDISDWKTKGKHAAKGKIAEACTKRQIAEEVWAQLKAALNDDGEVLADANRVAWFVDPDIIEPNPSKATNLEPLLVNTKGSWKHRPTAELPEVDNLFLASDFVRTYTDLATMEAANEAARRAVNAILKVSGSGAEPCAVWKLREAGGVPFALAREVDRILYKVLGARHGPPPTVELKGGELKTNPISRLPGLG